MLSILVLFYLATDLCRHLKFTTPVDGYALHGHVIKNITFNSGMRGSCKGRCTIDSNCVSINIGPTINDKVLCQLSNSDHIQHPDDVKPRDGFMYRGTEVGDSDSRIVISVSFLVSLSVCLSASLFVGLFASFSTVTLNYTISK